MQDEEKRIKHEMWEVCEEIKMLKKKLVILKQQLLQVQGEKHLQQRKKVLKKDERFK